MFLRLNKIRTLITDLEVEYNVCTTNKAMALVVDEKTKLMLRSINDVREELNLKHFRFEGG